MRANPLVSVIIPTYNRAHLVGRAIRSVLAQTFQDFEVIVVDDGSTDNTQEVMRSFNDSRIRFLSHLENRGVPSAYNTGIRAARGEYIAFLDSDDEWLPAKLERQLAVFRESKLERLGLVQCGVTFITAKGVQEKLPVARGWVFNHVLAKDIPFLAPPCWLVKRSVGNEGFFDATMPFGDWDWLTRVSRLFQIDIVAEPLVVAHQETHSRASANLASLLREFLCFLEKHSAEFAQRPRALGSLHRDIAHLYYRCGHMGGMRRHYFLAARAYRKHSRLYMLLGAALLMPLPWLSYRVVLKMFRTVGGFR